MKTKFGHILFNILPDHQEFYAQLFEFLGWKELYRDREYMGLGNDHGESLWFTTPNKLQHSSNDYDGPGINHVAIQAESISDIELVANFLPQIGAVSLFGTPCHRPEFSPNAESTYFQVMFQSPDNILFEVVYTGKK